MNKVEVDSIIIEINCGKSKSKEFCSKVKCPDCGIERLVRNGYIVKQKKNK